MSDQSVPHEKAALIFTDHDILFRRNAPQGATFQYVTPATVRAAFASEPLDMGWMHPNVRRAGWGRHGRWFLLHFPPQVHAMHVLRGEEKERKIKVPMPGLVWIAYGSAYYIAAVKEKNVSDKTALFEAPLPNHSGLGQICWGTGRQGVPKASGDILGGVWALLWDSVFNEHSAQGKSQSHPDNILDLLISLHGAEEYPLNDLVPMRQAVGAALQSILNDRTY